MNTPRNLSELAAVFRDAWNDADRENRSGERVHEGLRAVFAVLDEDRTVKLEGPEHLVIHIEGLQATLTKRNARITQLEEQLADALAGEPTQAAQKKAYQRGFRAAAAQLMEVTRVAARALGDARSEAFRIYLDAEHVERPAPSVSSEEISPIEKTETPA